MVTAQLTAATAGSRLRRLTGSLELTVVAVLGGDADLVVGIVAADYAQLRSRCR